MNNCVLKETLSMSLKLQKNIEHIRFALNKVKPSKSTISVNKTDILIMATNRRLGMAPNIRKHKLKRSFNYMTRLRKRKLMALVLLTCITNGGSIIVGHNWKLMVMKNMTDDGDGRVTKSRMPLRGRHTNTAESSNGWHMKHIKTMAQATSKKYVPHVRILNKNRNDETQQKHYWRE
jgi:hypothetical protein